jgi:microcystin-dependent protein
MFAGNFAPRGWAFCDGQLLAVSQNDALFSLLGTIYGGDGRTTFGLPDLRGRLPMEQGSGPGLSPRRLGAKFGAENETLTVNQLASHNHDVNGSTAAASSFDPGNKVLAAKSTNMYTNTGTFVTFPDSTIVNTGGNQSHINLMPALAVNFIIALVGVYPSRN